MWVGGHRHLVPLLWLRTSHSWSGAGCRRQRLFAWAQRGLLVPISITSVKVLCFACAFGLQQSVTCPTDTPTARAGWEMFRQNPFSSEFADLLEWKCASEMFPRLSGPNESCARLHATFSGGLADDQGSIKICGVLAVSSPVASYSWLGATLGTGQLRCRTCSLLQQF